MEQAVNLKKVQTAIDQLRDRGERVSRRNVRAITGGGMSTVHKLMSEAEDYEALRSMAPQRGISETLLKAIQAEIGGQVKIATTALREQVISLQQREAEALEALTEIEAKNETLAADLETVTQQTLQKQQEMVTAKAVAAETICRLEQTVIDLQYERQKLTTTLEEVRISAAQTTLQIEVAEQAAGKAENNVERLERELQRLQKSQSETEKRAAASAQKAADLREALAKAEKRIRFLEQK